MTLLASSTCPLTRRTARLLHVIVLLHQFPTACCAMHCSNAGSGTTASSSCQMARLFVQSLQTGRAAKRKWDQPAPPAAAAPNAAPAIGHFPQAAPQLSSPPQAPYQQQPAVSQPPYQDPQRQQSGLDPAYQQHAGSLGMQSMPSSSYGPPNPNMPPGSMGMHNMSAGTPWQSASAQQQMPWGMTAQAPGYPQHPQPGMGGMTQPPPGEPTQ